MFLSNSYKYIPVIFHFHIKFAAVGLCTFMFLLRCYSSDSPKAARSNFRHRPCAQQNSKSRLPSCSPVDQVFPISKHSRDLKCKVYIMHFLLQSQHRNKQSLPVQLIFCLNHTLNFSQHLMVAVPVSPIQPNTVLLLLWCGI